MTTNLKTACEEAADKEREHFEEAAFLQYFLSGIRETNDPLANVVQIHHVPTKQKNKAEFLEKKEDGSYVEPTLNSAWWAWRMALRKVGPLVEIAKDHIHYLENKRERLIEYALDDRVNDETKAKLNESNKWLSEKILAAQQALREFEQ